MMDQLVAAFIEDDRAKVRKLLKADRDLVKRRFDRPRLLYSGIFHWIYEGDTALHVAAAGYRVEIVGMLLDSGADPNSAMNHRRSGPLHYAADGHINGEAWGEKRQVRTIKRLLASGADVNAQDKNGATPLHRAVRTRCSAAVICLLKAGADPTAKNKPGSTPFHLAVQNTGRGGSGAEIAKAAQRQIIETFLSVGVSTRLKDGNGKSVKDSARSSWISELLGDG